jgi:predicted ATP-dependent endonuclease of OLD family
MAKIHTLKISNYRGIKEFEQIFGGSTLICLIGRGDSGKTTILNAISVVLSPHWNHSFYDTDFFQGAIENPIEIEANLYDLPNELLGESKYGLHKKILVNNDITNDLSIDESEECQDILTVKLEVTKELEPKWYVDSGRQNQERIEISANDRAKLNVFLISDTLDRHFSWSKGNPLYSLLRLEEKGTGKNNVLMDAFRSAKEKVDNNSFSHLDSTVKKVKDAAAELGLDLANTQTTIDLRDLSIKEGRICLHEDDIPVKQKGKGSKRLLSIAIQKNLAESGGIILIDEIEQGLEPDRVRYLVNKLKVENKGQVFFTTHSSNVVVELGADNLFLMRKRDTVLKTFDSSFQGCLRNNPEAFFTKKILVCEGATEVGICRSLNLFRVRNGESNFALHGIGIVDGSGTNFIKYCEDFQSAGYDVCAFCDSDDDAINLKKKTLSENGVIVVDCENGNSIEQQLFNDLSWESVIKLIEYAIDENNEDSIIAQTSNQFEGTFPTDNFQTESKKLRIALGKASVLKVDKSKKKIDKSWFKRIDHGEFLGNIWFDSISDLSDKKLNDEYTILTNWIENV